MVEKNKDLYDVKVFSTSYKRCTVNILLMASAKSSISIVRSSPLNKKFDMIGKQCCEMETGKSRWDAESFSYSCFVKVY